MSAHEGSMEHLPYYREYVEQILRPRVVRLVDEVRANLANHVWNELLERMAEDQNAGGSMDAALIQKMRILLEQTLGLRIGVQMQAEFGEPVRAATPIAADRVDVVDRNAFPDNPLARAVGGMRRPVR